VRSLSKRRSSFRMNFSIFASNYWWRMLARKASQILPAVTARRVLCGGRVSNGWNFSIRRIIHRQGTWFRLWMQIKRPIVLSLYNASQSLSKYSRSLTPNISSKSSRRGTRKSLATPCATIKKHRGTRTLRRAFSMRIIIQGNRRKLELRCGHPLMRIKIWQINEK